jgi:CHAD domain-containing protein
MNPMPAPKTTESRLLKYLDELVEDLRGLVPRAVKEQDKDAIHDARVATRRLKAATDLMDSILSKKARKPFDKITRSLRKQLGPLRDLDVMLDHLGEMRSARFADASTWLRDRLIAKRDEAQKEAQKKAPPAKALAKLGSWWGVRQEILEGQEAIDSLLAQSVHLQLDAFAERAAESENPEEKSDPHMLRIAGKSLRYTLEMARHEGFSLPRGTMSLFKKMQDSLGLWHDYVVLTECMLRETVDCDLALHQPELQNKILSLAQQTLRKAHIHLGKMREQWKARGEELCAAIRLAFPLTTPDEIIIAVSTEIPSPQETTTPEPTAPVPPG